MNILIVIAKTRTVKRYTTLIPSTLFHTDTRLQMLQFPPS